MAVIFQEDHLPGQILSFGRRCLATSDCSESKPVAEGFPQLGSQHSESWPSRRGPRRAYSEKESVLSPTAYPAK